MTWLSIDGGNEAKTGRACYVAEWRDTQLVSVESCTVDEAREDIILLGAPSCVVVERHQQDKRISGGGGRVPPGVIIDLAWNTAAVAYTLARGAPVHEYTPTVWIGGVCKPALHQRIWRSLSPLERKALTGSWPAPHTVESYLRGAAKAYATKGTITKHPYFNVLDAVGVGLFHLGRVGKGAAPLRAA